MQKYREGDNPSIIEKFSGSDFDGICSLIAIPALYVFVGLPQRMKKISIASNMFQAFGNSNNLTKS